MKFSTTILSAVLIASVVSIPVRRDVDPNLVPDLGFTAGKNPTGTGDCDGAVNGSDGKPIKVPCACPPDRQTFLAALNANVAAGKAINNPSVGVTFPTDNSIGSQEARIEAAIVTLQNLHGPGQGCPVVSTTLGAQQQAIQNGGSASSASASSTAVKTSVVASATQASATSSVAKSSASSSAAVSSSAAAPNASSAGGVDPNLVPDLGFTAGKNPTGTGDCDGAVNGSDGKPIKVPCACPPDRQTFIAALNTNVAAGKAVNNPSVVVTFPTDNSIGSQEARIEAAIVTLQNLHGPGQGCPVVSTTLGAQQQAIQNGGSSSSTHASAVTAKASATSSVVSATFTAVKSSTVATLSAATPTASASSAGGVDPNLVPDLGFTAGKNPTGTGDCDGAVNGSDGKPIKVPCACPPDRQTFINALNANVAAGKAVNNPSVAVTFPTDNSIGSQEARIEAAIVTLQNLHGPGQGCPVVSTTLGAQQKAIQDGGSTSQTSASSSAPKSSAAAAKSSAAAVEPSSSAAKSSATAAKSSSSAAKSSTQVATHAGKTSDHPAKSSSHQGKSSSQTGKPSAPAPAVPASAPAAPAPSPAAPAAASAAPAPHTCIIAGDSAPQAPPVSPPSTFIEPSSPSLVAKPPTASSAAAAPVPSSSGVDPNLVPDLGFTAGKNPTGTGDCDGAVNGSDGKPIKVPCACPPNRQTFIAALNANVAAGKAVNNPTVAVTFPTDNSVGSEEARIEAAIVTLQNLHGPGQGCPVVSTTLGAQQQAIQNGGSISQATVSSTGKSSATSSVANPPTASSAALAATSSASAAAPSSTGGVDPDLVPDLGFTAGKNPTGTGDCDGAVNGADGKPIKVPCSCPPDRQTFINALNVNVAAGKAVNNPSVGVSFPTDNSVASQAARIEAAIVTLQNLDGPGKGCPVVSTTLGAQQQALQG